MNRISAWLLPGNDKTIIGIFIAVFAVNKKLTLLVDSAMLVLRTKQKMKGTAMTTATKTVKTIDVDVDSLKIGDYLITSKGPVKTLGTSFLGVIISASELNRVLGIQFFLIGRNRGYDVLESGSQDVDMTIPFEFFKDARFIRKVED